MEGQYHNGDSQFDLPDGTLSFSSERKDGGSVTKGGERMGIKDEDFTFSSEPQFNNKEGTIIDEE